MGYVPNQYESAREFLGKPANLGNIYDSDDATRIAAYTLYEDFYANRPTSFRLISHENQDTEIYLPSTKKIVDSTARFLAVDFDFQVKGGNAKAVETFLRDLWKRENIGMRHIKGKKSMLSRGDLLWHITADTRKPAGKRLSLNTIHPSTYFPIEDPENSQRIIGCHIVDLVRDPREKARDTKRLVARRLTYRRELDGSISSEAGTFEIGAWDDRWLEPKEIKPVTIIWPKRLLPQSITAIPVYHIPNNEPDGSTWGMSQVAGIEYIINALNQSITYEDLTLVLQGLGVYVSTAGPPVEGQTNKQGEYQLAPGNVIEISQGDDFRRVSGVGSVSPFQEHLKALDAWMLQGTGLPEMATGTVDVAVAQSGIALALKMGPIIAENSDKELAISGKWDQMGYDLINGWLPAFEGIQSEKTEFNSVFGDPMPLDRDSYVRELIELYSSDLLLIDEVREKLEKIGYRYSADLVDKLLTESQRKSQAALGDPSLGEANATSDNLLDTLNNNGLKIVT